MEFPPRPEYVRLARHAVGALARQRGLPGQTTMDLELAVSEACTLAMYAGSRDGDHRIRLVVSADASAVEIEVHHPGAELESGGAGEDAGDFPFEQSLSLAVIRGLVDELSTRPGPNGAGTSYRILLSIPETATP